MVIKPYAPRSETDRRRVAGHRAERSMAHYLDRYFGGHDRIHVLHDVRIEAGGDRAQIDHLVVHRYGIAIVESKSISTQVRINAQDEWERFWNGRWRGMPDPLLQAERQGVLIKRLLTSQTSRASSTTPRSCVSRTSCAFSRRPRPRRRRQIPRSEAVQRNRSRPFRGAAPRSRSTTPAGHADRTT